jgi:hypothetical protein
MSNGTKATILLAGGAQVAGLVAGVAAGLLFGAAAAKVVGVAVIAAGLLYALSTIDN